jgi:hypothetical protein
MRYDNESHFGIRWDRFEKRLQRLNSACRRSDANNKKSIFGQPPLLKLWLRLTGRLLLPIHARNKITPLRQQRF